MVEILSAKAEDRESIQRIYESLVGSHASQDETIWDRLIQAGCLLVAQTEVQIIGFGGIDLNATEQVKWLYLLPQYQGTGIGSQILKQLESIGWKSGCESLRLHSAPQAVEFYRRQGYKEVEATEQLGHDHEGVEMVKEREAPSP
ncbi:MAG: GNAT family N-acetyltransferase [Pyrinomonadaceae bacterium]